MALALLTLIAFCTLGVGYETIGALLQGEVPRAVILGILIVKSSIWAIALGSGTSGGVLAPLLMMGRALGGLEAACCRRWEPGSGRWSAWARSCSNTNQTGPIRSLNSLNDISRDAEPMSQPADLAHFLELRREAVLAEWMTGTDRRRRRHGADASITRDLGARLLDRLIYAFGRPNSSDPGTGDDDVEPTIEPLQTLNGREVLQRAILRVAAGEDLAFAARDLLMLNDTIDLAVGVLDKAHLAAERPTHLEPEAAHARARDVEARSDAVALRQRFLAEASRLLAESMDYSETLKTVARLAVPGIADWCVVDLMQDDGRMARVAIEHRDPSRLQFAQKLQENFPPRTGATVGPAHVVHSGATEFEPCVTESLLEQLAPEAERRRLLTTLGMNSYVSVVLSTRGHVLGVITFFCESGRSLSAEDVAMAEDLAHRAATAIDNARLYDQAQRAVRVRDDMLAIVTHDLRTPLSVIVTAAAMQVATAPQDDNGVNMRQRAESIQRAAEHMSRLVRDLTDIGQMDSGRFAIERKPEELSALVYEVVHTLEPAAIQRGSRLRAEIDGPVLPMDVDGDRIIQVLSNLVSNAIQIGAPDVIVRLEARADEVLFTVSDTGPGVREEEVPHMLDRYWRSTTASYKGTGLGLPISKQIVNAHGGRIWIKSEPGVGTRFLFTLPR